MATNEESENIHKNHGITSDAPVSDTAKKSKKGWVIVGCIVAVCMCCFFPFVPYTTLFMIAVVLLSIYLDKHAVVSKAVRKMPNSAEQNRYRYGGLLGILAVLLFVLASCVLQAVLRGVLRRL